MTNLETFIENNESYFLDKVGAKNGIVESFELKSERVLFLRPNWYNTNGVFFDPKYCAEGEIVEVIPSDEWKVGETVVKKCDPVTDATIITAIQDWRTFKGTTPEASRDKAKKYLIDSYQGDFLSESDFV